MRRRLPSLACAALASFGCSNGANAGFGSVTTGGGRSQDGSAGAGTEGGAGNGGNSSGSGGGSDGASGTGGGVDASADASSSGGMAGAIDMSVSVLERNKHPSRDGNFVQPLLTKAKAAAMAMDANFNATFVGLMYGSPLYLDQGPGGKGIFIAATTSNDVFALDETDGHTVWTKNIGASPLKTGAGCGDVMPVGIISTPVIDPKPGADGFATIYVAGGIGTAGIMMHEVHALSAKDGSERAGWPVNASNIQAAVLQDAGSTFALTAQNQRSALSLVGGILYVAYGGHSGDCGGYHGFVVAISTADPTKAGAWATQGVGEAIWAPGGMASDGVNGVFAVTGNRTAGGGGVHQDSEEVVHVTGLGLLNRSNANIYYPADWSRLDGSDQDFSASSPVYFSVPGATPVNYIGAATKDGTFYLLDSANLGGMDGHVAKLSIARSILTTPGAYTSKTGVHVVLQANGAQCPAGIGNNSIVSISIPAGAPPVPTVAWCAPIGSQTGPITTTSDGKNDPIVWFVDGQNLVGVDGDTGTNVATATGACAAVRQWTSPIAVKGRIIVGADNRLCSWSPH